MTEKCEVCGEETETSDERQIGGDINSNGNLSGMADVPCVVWCECGAAYFDGERAEEYDE